MLCWDYVPFLNFAGKTRGKQGQQLPYKLMAQDKNPVFYNLLGQQSHMLMSGQPLSRVLISELQFLIFCNEMLTIETAVSSANL